MANIFIHDEFDPESLAMMQALYSRSPESVEIHAKKVLESGSASFMESYYVGYGHASIGDCGTTTLFFEGVSILAAKAIQDNPLYSGQETSTRYIDFANQPLFDPIGTADSHKILSNWIDFYIVATEEIRSYLKHQFPIEKGQSQKIWNKAINARAFDVLRGFLPAGATTQLSWSTNLRQAYDKLSLLKLHPLKEVQSLAKNALDKLTDKYPSSFSHKMRAEQDEYYARFSDEINYSNYIDKNITENDFFCQTSIDNQIIEKEVFGIISERPKDARIPRFLSKYGRYNCKFLLDYGSFRDLQRHRNGLCRLPILTDEYGFNSWYLDQLPKSLREAANALIVEQNLLIKRISEKNSLSNFDIQYYLPLGYNVLCELVYDLPEMVYVTELRSSSTVHPTLRRIALKMHKELRNNHPALNLFVDTSQDVFDIKRGTQDIERLDI
jgi:thymidylate synthase ThyX